MPSNRCDIFIYNPKMSLSEKCRRCYFSAKVDFSIQIFISFGGRGKATPHKHIQDPTHRHSMGLQIMSKILHQVPSAPSQTQQEDHICCEKIPASEQSSADIRCRRGVQFLHSEMILEHAVQNLVVPLIVEMLPFEIQYALGDDVPKHCIFISVDGSLSFEVRKVSPVVTGLLLFLKFRKITGGGLRFRGEWRPQCNFSSLGVSLQIIGLIHNNYKQVCGSLI